MSDKINILDQEELEYLSSTAYLEDYPGLIDAMKEQRFTISDLGVTARDATYWAKKGILPELSGTHTTRRKYNLKQAVWIKLIQQLRFFDVSLNQIKKIKDHLLKVELNVRELIENEKMNLILEELAKRSDMYQEFKEFMDDPEFLKEIEQEHIDFFEIMVLYTIVFRRDVSYLVDVDGYCFPYIFDRHELMRKELPQFEMFMKSPHILLSVSQAYSQLIQDWSEKKWFNEVSIVSKDEKKILGLLRDKSTKELRIMKKGNKVDRVIIVKNKSIDAIEEFANHIVRNGYQTMTISTRGGKPVHFKNEVSMKLKNIPE